MRIESGIMLLAVTAALAQSPPAAWKEFSVGPPTANRTRFGPQGMRAEGVPFRRVLARAFGVPEHRIIGPGWIDGERYAITALVNDPKDFQPLMQQELAARWHMLAHREMKDVPVYEIRTLDGASVLTPQAPPAANARPTPSIRLNQQSVKTFADTLADVLARPVFDETKLDGIFDFAFSWTSTDPASLKSAMASQLGLNLVDTRRVVDLVIVDHIEKLP
jgi:uncharacterized protein (TIGR03435 family)